MMTQPCHWCGHDQANHDSFDGTCNALGCSCSRTGPPVPTVTEGHECDCPPPYEYCPHPPPEWCICPSHLVGMGLSSTDADRVTNRVARIEAALSDKIARVLQMADAWDDICGGGQINTKAVTEALRTTLGDA